VTLDPIDQSVALWLFEASRHKLHDSWISVHASEGAAVRFLPPPQDQPFGCKNNIMPAAVS